MTIRKRSQRRRKPIKMPSVYRYMLLGLILPISVFTGMVLGNNYGQVFGGAGAAVFAAVGSIVGLIIATVVIVEVALFWDKNIQKQVRKPKVEQSRGNN